MANGNPVETKPGLAASVLLWMLAIAAGIFWIAIAIQIGQLALGTGGPAAAWAASIVCTVALLVLAGRAVNERWLGVLIDARNKYSLARLQITIWTVMVMTAYLTIAIPRIRLMAQGRTLTQAQALDIRFPEELILAMGISAVSFAGSSLIKRTKTSRTTTIEAKATPDATRDRRDKAKAELTAAEAAALRAAQAETDRKAELDTATAAAVAAGVAKPADDPKVKAAETLLASARIDVEKAKKDLDVKKTALDTAEKDYVAAKEAEGLLHRNASPAEASWVDLVRGEEIGNYKLVDMSKVQMLFFTVVVVASYAGAIVALMYNLAYFQEKPPLEVPFPEFSETLTALLGISHGTYLSVKAVDHS